MSVWNQSLFLKRAGMLLLMSLFLLSHAPVFAHSDHYYNHLNGGAIAAGGSVQTSETWFGLTNNGLFDVEDSYGLVKLRYDYALSTTFASSGYVRCTMDVKSWSVNGTLTTTTGLVLEVDVATGQLMDIHKVAGAHKIRAEITAVSLPTNVLSAPINIWLETEVHTERYYDVNYAATLTPYAPQSDYNIDLSLGSNRSLATISWSHVPGAEYYELEWIVLDDPFGDVLASPPATVDFSQASRVDIETSSYELVLGYPQSLIGYRVRPVFYYDYSAGISNEKVYGAWSTQGFVSGTDSDLPDYDAGYIYAFAGADGDRNWQFQRVFAEEGKSKEVMTYADGTLRQRQTVTRLNTQQESMVAEVVYDYQGRAVVQVLPFPTAENDIHFYEGASKVGANNLSRADFDQQGNLYSMPALSNTAGAAKYYSAQNDVLTGSAAILDEQPETYYIPDANGYVYTRTIYTDDATGRVKFQSGVGETFVIQDPNNPSRRQTEFYYTGTTQAELVRLFGRNAGDQSHYRKEMTRDPNGQLAVKYVDMQNRTIATALAGDRPPNLLDVGQDPQEITSPLTTAGLLDASGTVETAESNVANTNPSGTDFKFHYFFDGTMYGDGCADFCMTCGYRITFRVIDPEGDPVGLTLYTDGTYATALGNPLTTAPFQNPQANPTTYDLVLLVNPGAPDPGNCVVNLSLPGIGAGSGDLYFKFNGTLIGNYKIIKTIEQDPAFLQAYLAYFDANHNYCGLSASTTVDLTDCDNACIEAAIAALGGTPTLDEIATWIEANGCGEGRIEIPNGNFPGAPSDPCEAECYNLKVLLEQDAAPGGQYYNDDAWLVYSLDESVTNNFAGGTGPAGNSVQLTSSTVTFAVMQSWRTAMYQCNDAQDVAEWATILSEYHPEYCHYEWCINSDMQLSCAFDRFMEGQTTYPPATTWNGNTVDLTDPADVVAPTACGVSDPFFIQSGCTGGPGPGASLLATMQDLLQYYPTGLVGGSTVDIYEATEVALTGLVGNGQLDNATEWNMFKQLYAGLKRQMVRDLKAAQACPYLQPGGSVPAFAIGKIIRVPDPTGGLATGYASLPGAGVPANTALCESYCETTQAMMWESQLSSCIDWDPAVGLSIGGMVVPNTTCYDWTALNIEQGNQTMNLIQWIVYGGRKNSNDIYHDGLVDRCMAHCNDNDFGCLSVEDYENTIADIFNYLDQPCFNVQSTNSATGNTWLEDLIACMQVQPCETAVFPCACDRFNLSSNPYGYSDAAGFNTYWGTSATTTEINNWYTACEGGTLLQSDLPVELKCLFDPTPFSWDEGQEPCEEYLTALDAFNMQQLLNGYLQQARDEFIAGYTEKCMKPKYRVETFEVTYAMNEYQYTLYYYDQSGTLVQTVPPKGVDVMTDVQIADYMMNGTVNNWGHTYETRYTFNSYNQPLWQLTPDGGETNFWYNDDGQLRASQNAKQKQSDRFAYTLYDALGRIVEAGETADCDGTSTPPITDLLTAANLNNVSAWPPATLGNHYDVNRTVYSNSSAVYSGFVQQTYTLRGRVAKVTRYGEIACNCQNQTITEEPWASSHYNYDVAGNVNELLQQNHLLSYLGEDFYEFKVMTYDFDLISGKVNAMDYQPGQPDQFHYRYEYDADNRVIAASTSKDNLIWEEDARYEYYRHGPLARTEIGQDLIQGADMAYTLQGWMRGMNSARLETAYDPGKDAVSGNRHGRYGQDAFAYSLGYFHVPNTNVQDYHSIGQSGFSSDNFLIDQLSAGDYYNSYKDLYNGNISHMTINMLDENGNNRTKIAGKGYQYDQLNRLREVRQFDQFTTSWQANQAGNNEAYRESYAFDKNGNIEKLLRNGTAALEEMDSLGYHYNGTDNRLQWLSDREAAGNYSEDLDHQSSNPPNYSYDAIGQLTGDLAEGITVEWDAFNKVTHVDKNVALGNPTDIYFYYDGMGHRFAQKSVSNNPIVTTWTLYQRDASGNVISTYEVEETAGQLAFEQEELHLYGSDRLGILKPGRNMGTMSQNTQTLEWVQSVAPAAISATRFTRVVGMKEYELKNHLGNVMSVVSDRKTYVVSTSFTGFTPEVRSYQDYYAFGSLQPGRNYSSGGYRYGFNGMEKDAGVSSAEGGSYTTEFRQFDSRVGRWWSCDPFSMKYPAMSPYSGMGNSPISIIDQEGDTLRIFGTEAEWNRFKTIIEAEFDGVIELRRDVNNNVTVHLRQDQARILHQMGEDNYFMGLWNSEKLGFLKTIIGAPETTEAFLINDQRCSQVFIGTFRSGEMVSAPQLIDVGDVEAVSAKLNPYSAVLHELWEQYSDVVSGSPTVFSEQEFFDQFLLCHNAALQVQAKICGNLEVQNVSFFEDKDIIHETQKMRVYASKEGTWGIFSEPIWSVTEIITDKNGDVISVTNRNVKGVIKSPEGNIIGEK